MKRDEIGLAAAVSYVLMHYFLTSSKSYCCTATRVVVWKLLQHCCKLNNLIMQKNYNKIIMRALKFTIHYSLPQPIQFRLFSFSHSCFTFFSFITLALLSHNAPSCIIKTCLCSILTTQTPYSCFTF